MSIGSRLMTTNRLCITLIAIAALALGHSALRAQEPARRGLAASEFEKLHKELQPPQDEMWRTIPWHVSIVEAQQAAAKSKRPIFVWVASGEPLGCG
jgi:hypothetical protein